MTQTDNQTEISITSLDNSHGTQAVNLILPIQQLEFKVAITAEQQPDLMDIEGFYIRPGGNFWGAFSNGQLVGTIALISIGHQAGAIRKMFVKKEFRGKEHSIAQRLMDILLQFSRERGISDIYLGTVNVMLAAQRFYERNGFHEIARTNLPGYFPLMAADNKFYHLHIDSK